MVHWYDCMILFQSSHRGLVHLTLAYSHSEQHIRVLSVQHFITLETRVLHARADGPVTGQQGHPRSHPSLLVRTPQSCPENSTSRCCWERHTLGENSNGFIKTRLWIPFFSSLVELSYDLPSCVMRTAELCAKGSH